jgi:hypothetical protein
VHLVLSGHLPDYATFRFGRLSDDYYPSDRNFLLSTADGHLMGGYYLRWKIRANAAGIAALLAYFGSGSLIATVALWLLSCAFAVKSLAYTSADARTDRIIQAIQPLCDGTSPSSASVGQATEPCLERVLINRDCGASYSMSAMPR